MSPYWTGTFCSMKEKSGAVVKNEGNTWWSQIEHFTNEGERWASCWQQSF
jgi:hypothetical protein